MFIQDMWYINFTFRYGKFLHYWSDQNAPVIYTQKPAADIGNHVSGISAFIYHSWTFNYNYAEPNMHQAIVCHSIYIYIFPSDFNFASTSNALLADVSAKVLFLWIVNLVESDHQYLFW